MEDFLGGSIYVVFDSAIFQKGWVEDRVATSPVFVAWLPNASDVDHRFGLGKPVSVVEGVWGEELVIGGEYPRRVGMPLEAIGLNHAEEFFHLAAVENIVGKDVFIDWIADRAVDKQKSVLAMNPRQFQKEKDPASGIVGIFALLDLLTSPKDSAFGRGAESLWIVERSIIMVAYDAYGHLHDEVQTFPGVWTVPDDIA